MIYDICVLYTHQPLYINKDFWVLLGHMVIYTSVMLLIRFRTKTFQI